MRLIWIAYLFADNPHDVWSDRADSFQRRLLPKNRREGRHNVACELPAQPISMNATNSIDSEQFFSRDPAAGLLQLLDRLLS